MAKGGFRGGYGGGGGVNMNMIKQAQRMQQDMMRMQEELEQKTYTATAGGGLVTAVVNGKKELSKLTIDPDAIIDAEGEEDVEMITDTIIAAVNEALRKQEEDMSSSMAKITGGMGLGF